MEYTIIHKVNTSESDREKIKLAAARGIYAELIKYYRSKTAAERPA